MFFLDFTSNEFERWIASDDRFMDGNSQAQMSLIDHMSIHVDGGTCGRF